MYRLPTAADRNRLQRKAEQALFELILAEPTGRKTVRADMVRRTRDFVASLRRDLFPQEQPS